MASEPKTSRQNLLVLTKITAILDAFSLSRPELTLTEIREATGLPTSTVHRLVASLVDAGFLDRAVDRIRMGTRMSYWAACAVEGMDLVALARPVMDAFRDDTGESVGLFRASGTLRVCVALSETRHVLRRAMNVGSAFPLHLGSSGRVILAWSAEPLLREVVRSGLEPLADGTAITEQELRDAIHRTRSDGFAITQGERAVGAGGISAPVFNAQQDLVGALNLFGPTIRLSAERLQTLVDPTIECALQITRMIGGRHPEA